MKISISQPTLFPWIGYFDMIKKSDVFVFLDNVRFQKQSWQMRNRLKSGSKIEESEIWIRIPTNLSKTETLIKDVLIDNNQEWQENHIDIFQSNYGKKYKKIPFLMKLYEQEWDKIADFNMAFISQCCEFLEIKTTLLRASELEVTGRKSHLILDICKKLDATEFLPNQGSKNYLENDREIFEKENIKITYHNYEHEPYKQKGKIFFENLSILDLLFSEFKDSKKYI